MAASYIVSISGVDTRLDRLRLQRQLSLQQLAEIIDWPATGLKNLDASSTISCITWSSSVVRALEVLDGRLGHFRCDPGEAGEAQHQWFAG